MRPDRFGRVLLAGLRVAADVAAPGSLLLAARLDELLEVREVALRAALEDLEHGRQAGQQAYRAAAERSLVWLFGRA